MSFGIGQKRQEQPLHIFPHLCPIYISVPAVVFVLLIGCSPWLNSHSHKTKRRPTAAIQIKVFLMYRELGLLLTLCLPIGLLYLFRLSADTRGVALEKSKKRNNKKKNKKRSQHDAMPVHEGHGSVSVSVSSTVAPTTAAATAATTEPTLVKRTPVSVTAKGSSDKPKDKGKGKGKGKDKDKGKGKDTVPVNSHSTTAPIVPIVPIAPIVPTAPTAPTAPGVPTAPTKEVDNHMDLTQRYARVLRIKTETEEPLAPVPIEAGWNRTAVRSGQRPSHLPTGPPPPTSKKQRENLAKAQKRKEQKSAQETLQMERLRQHQKQLATQKINAFYTTGAGKPSSWKNPQGKHSAKVPTTSAGLNEHGQLIWD